METSTAWATSSSTAWGVTAAARSGGHPGACACAPQLSFACLYKRVHSSVCTTSDHARFPPCQAGRGKFGRRDFTARASGVELFKAHEEIRLQDEETTTQQSDGEKVANLIALNQKLLARIAELESQLQEAKGAESAITTPGSQGARCIYPDVKDIVWPSPTDSVPFWKRRFLKAQPTTAWELKENGAAAVNAAYRDDGSLHVVHVTSEMAPLAKVGGLGDVVTGLARACIESGHKVEVMLPFYECIPRDQIEHLTKAETYSSYHRGGWVSVTNYRGTVSGVPVVFVEPSNHFFRGSRIYGGSYDELEAYLFFSRACLEWLQVTDTQPDILHVHEWQTAGLPLLYWDMYHHLSLQRPRIVLTIHNMEHHGECRVEQLDMCGLDGASYRVNDKAIDDRTIGHNPERLSLLKGGIVYSNAVTTVSPTYVNETLCSGWLSGTLMKHRKKYTGILNGIDTVLWDPATDPVLPAGFTAKELAGKQICKHYLQRGLGLDLDTLPTDELYETKKQRLPLVVCITRLVAQKGLHLIRHAVHHVEYLGGQFILLGTAPEPRVQSEFEELAKQLKDNKRIKVLPTYSEELAHLLYAAADMVLVPSMFEPCGLTQMTGMRYGAIPVVRKTGGLADTVFDVDDEASTGRANGFVFDGINDAALDTALGRAIRYYNERPDWWMDLTSRVMEVDNSWNKSAGEYLSLYESVRVR